MLIKSSTYRAQAFTEAARRLGVEVLVGVDLPPELAKHWQVPLAVQFAEPEQAAQAVVEFARRNPVQAVLAIDDSATIIAAMASEALGLPHNSYEAALAARNKYRMRQALQAAGLLCPWFRLYDMADDPAGVAAEAPYPCVVKPLLLSGSRGVMRANDPAEFQAAFQRLARMLNSMQRMPGSTRILVESFIPGFEVAVEGLLDQGRLHVLALFDKPDPLDGPFFEETIYVTPSRLPEEVQADITASTARAAAALGLVRGPVHAELRVNEAGAWLVEVAGRSIGGLCSHTLRFGPGLSLEELILRQAVGLDIEDLLRLEHGARGVMMIPIPEAGILKEVRGTEEARQVPGIEAVEITAPVNYPLTPLPEGESYLGFIFAVGSQPEQVERALRQAHQRLRFQIEPMLPLL